MKRSRPNRPWVVLVTLFLVTVLASPVSATVEPERPGYVAAKAFRNADLDIPVVRQAVSELGAERAQAVRQRLARLGATEQPARIDARSGRFETMWPATPLVPGTGVGNNLTWSQLQLVGPPATTTEALETAA
ncbi:MAG: hypothetical protein MPN21_09015 [Thermoanaerobaculia bacterium]|nr:hypothetical protein [Thermoanaerobaculia bacterium]